MRRRRPAIGNPFSTCCGATCPLAGSFLRSRAARANTSLTSLNRAGRILFSNRATQIPAPAPVWMPGPPHSIWQHPASDRARCHVRSLAPLLCRRRAVHQLDPYRTLGGRRRPHARRGRYPADRRRTFLYGPFRRNGCHTAPSNEAFDRDLRARNPAWGVRDLEAVAALAEAHGFAQPVVDEMPANNLSVIFPRQLP